MNNYSTDVFVKSFTHLRGMPHADRALPLLQRIASLVKPIMRKHGWVLPVLSEFFPDNESLLGEWLGYACFHAAGVSDVFLLGMSK
jgi:WLM domain